MKNTEFLNALEEKNIHVFTFNDAVRMSGKERPYARLMLNRMAKKNTIQRAERGFYYTKKASPLEIASNILHPSYVSLVSALSYYGVTTQIPITIDIISPRRHGQISLKDPRQNRIVFRTLKRGRMFAFYTDKNNISIAELEKAIVDAIYFKRPSMGQISEAIEVALKGHMIDMEKAKRYAHAMNSKATIKRLDSILMNIGANRWDFPTNSD